MSCGHHTNITFFISDECAFSSNILTSCWYTHTYTTDTKQHREVGHRLREHKGVRVLSGKHYNNALQSANMIVFPTHS